MKSLITITFIVCLFGFSLSQQTDQCSLNLSCDSSDTSCQNELAQFQQCVSVKCNSQKIQSQDIQEIFDCYYINCKPTYQPFLSEILNMFQCLNLSILEPEDTQDEQEDSKIDLEEIKENLKKTKEGQCLAQMISDCQASTTQCVSNFYIQVLCMDTNCQLGNDPSISQINQCISSTCLSSFDELKNLNLQFSQCLQQLSKTTFGYLPGFSILVALVLILI